MSNYCQSIDSCSIAECAKPIRANGLCSMHEARVGRHGSLVTNPKLSPGDVQSIRLRLANGELPRAIALDFGVTADSVRNIRSGKTWAGVK
jgi:hypothetical protein